ncbi:hypothetical protein Tco_1022703, partial [Tanacetum coccineum]
MGSSSTQSLSYFPRRAFMPSSRLLFDLFARLGSVAFSKYSFIVVILVSPSSSMIAITSIPSVDLH